MPPPESIENQRLVHSDQVEHRRFLATRNFGSLDGLRCLAIIAVVWHHYGPQVQAIPISGRGFLGVDLFFVISGFLIGTLLLREHDRTGSIRLLGFHARRALRVFPAYYAMLAVVIVWALAHTGSTSREILDDAPVALLLVTNLFPAHGILALTWSLSVEVQFYLGLPLIERFARGWAMCCLALLYVLFSLPALGLLQSVPLPDFFRQTTFGPILLGAMLAHLLNSPRGYAATARGIGPWTAMVALGLLIAVANADVAGNQPGGWHRILMHWLMALLVTSCVAREDQTLRRVLRLWPVRRIGQMSYGIYLYHHLAAHVAMLVLGETAAAGMPARFPGVILASWLAAEMSYRWIESPFLAAKGRFEAPSNSASNPTSLAVGAR